jgi:predicted MFS family arabinose efflux permease
MGSYTAFFDLGIAIASPALGLVAGIAGLKSVFLTSALIVLFSAMVAIRLLPHAPLSASAGERTGRFLHLNGSRSDGEF